ncbi:acyltransferase family protein [Mycobacterium vicinigordonae]|uniref:Acyltransferase n=1 Tax=Mycobacterium vicinigordonae TaxID=1719132 RepID=A0A7D6DW74_9MYCO|nr:acyltransferase [Mycobacterium vicinigordonae]QLL05390.1 acyltransferase [Mycobacterium vicinigordonae]
MSSAAPGRTVRNLAVDYYRVSGVGLIVLGHWLLSSITYRNGQFGRENPLVDLPWTQWATWPFQAVPAFFLVAGYAGAVSWRRQQERGGEPWQSWVRHRIARVLGPTGVYVGLIFALVLTLLGLGMPGSVLQYAGWALAMHLWFLAVYLVVVTLTPIAIAAHDRWGLRVPAAMAAGVAVVDAVTIGGHVPRLGWINYLLCWGMLYQLGITWHAGRLNGRRPLLLAAGSAAALALLIWLGPYPPSMIGVPGQVVQNSTPPTLALVAFGCAQAGIAVALAPPIDRALSGPRLRRIVAVANNNVMALYLWHMVPVIVVAVVAYPSGLLPQPEQATAAWWLMRIAWVLILCAAMAVEMAILFWLRRLFAAPLPMIDVPLGDRWTAPVMLVGTALAAYSLAFISADGFAPSGGFPWLTAIIFTVGLVLVASRSRRADPAPM